MFYCPQIYMHLTEVVFMIFKQDFLIWILIFHHRLVFILWLVKVWSLFIMVYKGPLCYFSQLTHYTYYYIVTIEYWYFQMPERKEIFARSCSFRKIKFLDFYKKKLSLPVNSQMPVPLSPPIKSLLYLSVLI